MEGKKLVAKIKSMVVSRGMSMTEFYKKSEITGGAMSQWKSGDTQPALSTLQRIADVLETTVSELVGTDEESKKPATDDGDGRNGITQSDANAFDCEKDVDIANRQEAIRIIDAYDSESLAQALSYLRFLAASSNPPPKPSQEDA